MKYNMVTSTTKRQKDNLEILRIIEETVMKYPELRFGQILWNLGIEGHDENGNLKDTFYEESETTLKNILSHSRM